MTLTNAFSMARAGINSAQTGIDLASRNIAGATEENYTKKFRDKALLLGVMVSQQACVSIQL